MRRSLLWLVGLVAGCGGSRSAPDLADSRPIAPLPAIRVGGVTAEGRYRAAGSVRALRRADLATRQMARIESVRVRPGDRVRQGQVLVTLEKGAVVAQGAGAEAGLDLATTNLRRMERLYADSAVPIAQLEAAQATYRQAKEQVSATTAELGYTALVAPFAGVVAARSLDPGDLASPGQPVLIIEDDGAREIVVGAPEPVAAAVKVGQTISVRIGSAEEIVAARVAAIVPAVDPISRLVEIRLTSTARLPSGVTAVAEFPTPAAAALTIPTTALVERGELTGVFLFQPDSTVRLRWVRIGRRTDANTEIVSGLLDGDLIVAAPEGVQDGARARPNMSEERRP